MRVVLFFVLLCLSCVWADGSGPDDALCSSYSGVNFTCSSCLIQGCTYCDMTGTGRGGVCLSHKTAHDTCKTDTTLISSAASLTQCRKTHVDLYEDLAAFMPIITGILGIIIFAWIVCFVRPHYATTSTEQVVQCQPLLGSSSHWIAKMQHQYPTNGWCYKILLLIILKVVFVLSVIAVSAGMWSIQVDSHDWNLVESAIRYDGYGVRTVSRDPNDHDNLMIRYMDYDCSSLIGDNFIRCSLHAILAQVTHRIAIMALTWICITAILMIYSLIRCRSFNNLSVKFMSMTAIAHLVVVLIYASGCYLLQSRIINDSYDTKNSPSYHLYLGLNWNVSVAACVINLVLLIPLTRAHIHGIVKTEQKECCWKKQIPTVEAAPMGVTIAVPELAPTNASAPLNPYNQGATSYMSPAYQYGTVQTTTQQKNNEI